MQKTVVSFADGVGNYAKAMMRLEQSLRAVHFDGTAKMINDYAHIGSPLHKGGEHNTEYVPYAFKPYSIQKAVDGGARYVLWCDSVVYATKSIDPIFKHIDEHGYLFFDNIGYSIGDYTSDRCLEYYGMSRAEAFDTKMIMACVMGFDLHSKEAIDFLHMYMAACKDGIYAGSWTNFNGEVSNDMRVKGHRHDQSVASCIIKRLGLTITNAQNTFFAYAEHKGKVPIADSVCLWSEGI